MLVACVLLFVLFLFPYFFRVHCVLLVVYGFVFGDCWLFGVTVFVFWCFGACWSLVVDCWLLVVIVVCRLLFVCYSFLRVVVCLMFVVVY